MKRFRSSIPFFVSAAAFASLTFVATTPAQAATIKHTFTVPNPTKFPQTVISAIKTNTKVPVILPQAIRLDKQLPKGTSLAADVDVSSNQYGMDIFERPTGSSTSQYANSTLIGYIGTTTLSAENGYYGHDKSIFKHKSAIKIQGSISAVEYTTGGNTAGGRLITWHENGWTYTSSGYPPSDGYNTTLGMANQIASYVRKRGVVVPHARRGYVDALSLGNRPDYHVTWTYNGRVWYMVDLVTLSETLNTAHSVAVVL
ncbi:hypothetical protein [Alicyclobacillus fodiniaquatilis]|uniref:Uncharacterized protein n=1 Tax=Alicyclobacillus fodiniaquatilis TaxID=1661150 RepID=A0ABW4JF46_9BACL